MRSASLSLLAAVTLAASACRLSDLANAGGDANRPDEPGGPSSSIVVRVTATDTSRPTGPAGRKVNLTGTVTFNGLSVELWDGTQWLSVANGSGSAVVAIGDESVAATLVPVTAIPAGEYTRVRIGATETVADLTAKLDGGQELSAQIRSPSGEPFVLEKDVTVTINPDGSRTLEVRFVLVRSVTVGPDPITKSPTLNVTGELTGQP